MHEHSSGANVPKLPQLQDSRDLSFDSHAALILTIMLAEQRSNVRLFAAQYGTLWEQGIKGARRLPFYKPSSCSDPSQLSRLK